MLQDIFEENFSQKNYFENWSNQNITSYSLI